MFCKRMRYNRVLSTMAVVLLCACGSKGATEVEVTTVADLAATWHLTQWEYALAADPSTTADWVAFGGLSGVLGITASGDFTVTPRLPGGSGEDQGRLTLQGDSVYWDGEDDEEWVRFTLVGRRLTLFWPEEEYVDMDRDGEPEDVRLRVVFER